MIIWLASYPRSGNSLTRILLSKTMGLTSTDVYTPDDPAAQEAVYKRSTLAQELGRFSPRKPWAEFYPEATASPEVFLVKTHGPPPDDQPALHIVRDGRKACVSYLNFHRKLHPEAGRTLPEIILGLDAFGDWSAHHAAWSHPGARPEHPRRRLLLRFEDLVQADMVLLRTIAGFIGYGGIIRPWENPFRELHARSPSIYREGRVDWTGDPEWTPLADALFARVHGPLMRQLGYWTEAEEQAALAGIEAGALELCAASAGLRARNPVFA
jgi:hypothetical protein